MNLEKLQDLADDHPYLICGLIVALFAAIGGVSLGEKIFRIQEASFQWVLFAIGIVLIIIDINRNWQRESPPLDGVTGGINQPANDAHQVPAAIEARGWVKNLRKGQHLWLVVENDNRLWPKAGEIQIDKQANWQHTVYEQGTEDTFSLSLYAANANGHKKIQEWLDLGPLIEYRTFLHEIPGTRRIGLIRLHKN